MADKTMGDLGLWIPRMNDSIDGPDGTIEKHLPENFQKIDEEFTTHKADYASAHGGTYHKNILHNWDFRNPVNQRGFTSTTNSGYTIDRWQLVTSGHAVEVVSDGIKLIAGKNAGLDMCFAQLVENYSRFVGVPLTLSMHIVENTLTRGCKLRRNENSGPLIMGTGYFTYTFTPSSLSRLQIGLQFVDKSVDDGNYLIIDKMKLEIGSVSTLVNDPPADYGEQLMLCKRFFRLWTTEAARTEALKEVGLMRIPNPTLGTIDIGGTTYYYASADL